MKTVKLSKLKQYTGNPRVGNVDLIAESLKERGGGTKNLDKLIKNFKERSRSHFRLKTLVDNLNDSDTKAIYNRIATASTQQLTRFQNSLEISEEAAANEEDVAKANAQRPRLQRLKSLGIKDVPASALESDEALDSFIREQGLIEPQYTEAEL